jgi:ribosomal protein S27AE
MDYYIHYMDGTTEVQHWCDECDEREALFFHHDHQYCGQCNEKEIQNLLQDLD